MWKTINSIKGKSQKNSTISEITVDETHSINNREEIADFINNHFTNIGPQLASQLRNPTKTFNHFINASSSTFQLTHIKLSDVLNLLKNLDINKSVGLDRIPNKLLKFSADIIAESLCLLFDSTLQSPEAMSQVIGKLQRFFHSTRATVNQILTIIGQFQF